MMRLLVRGLAAILLTLGLLTVGLGGSAFGAGDQLGLSWDGSSWATSLSGTLFDRPGSIASWVPGDVDTRSFRVRNRSVDDAALIVDYELPTVSARALPDVHFSVSVAGGTFVPLAPGSGWIELDRRSLGAASVVTVRVRAELDPASTNQSQDKSVPVAFRVTLAGIASPAPGGAADDESAGAGGAGDGSNGNGSGTGDLAGTGAPDLRWPAGISVACLVGGVLIVARARRQDRQEGRDDEAS